jgi:hypothetical protein
MHCEASMNANEWIAVIGYFAVFDATVVFAIWITRRSYREYKSVREEQRGDDKP